LSALPTRATHQQTRTFNQQLVLRAIYDGPKISRAEVARLTGLTRTSVSQLVADLLKAGLVAEIGRGPSSGGKAPILLSVVKDSRHVLGLDLGEQAFSGALVNLHGEIRHSISKPLEGRDGGAALELVLELVDGLCGRTSSPLLGIGIGAPGVVDSRSGTVRWAVSLSWTDLPLGSIVSQRYHLPVVVANDSQAAALAEWTFASQPRPVNLVVIRVGRGIGAGIILNGQLFRGDDSGAGEIGHTVFVPDGVLCRCGSVGCLETVASLGAIVREAGRIAPSVHDEQTLLAELEAGNAEVEHVVRQAGRMLGLGVGSLIGSLNITRVVLVGPAVALGNIWLEAVRHQALGSSLRPLAQQTRIDLGQERDDVVLGASALLMTHELGLSLVR
jgi:N-acetylglucosamine repressor